jgi:hypothetical protein
MANSSFPMSEPPDSRRCTDAEQSLLLVLRNLFVFELVTKIDSDYGNLG